MYTRLTAGVLSEKGRRRARVVKGMDSKPIVISRVGSGPTVDATFKRIRPGFIRRNSRVGFLPFLAVDAVLWWVP